MNITQNTLAYIDKGRNLVRIHEHSAGVIKQYELLDYPGTIVNGNIEDFKVVGEQLSLEGEIIER